MNNPVIKFIKMFIIVSALLISMVRIGTTESINAADYTGEVNVTDWNIYDEGTLIDDTNGMINGGTYQYEVKWELTPAGDVLHAGDTFTLPQIVNSQVGYLVLANSAYVDFKDSSGVVLGQWRINNGQIEVVLGANVEGSNTIVATFLTGANALKDVTPNSIVQDVSVGSVTKPIKFIAAPLVALPNQDVKNTNITSNNTVSWVITTNNAGVKELTEQEWGTNFTIKNDVYVEDIIEPGANISLIKFITYTFIPTDLTSGTATGAGALQYDITSLFTLVNQNAGESYTNFKSRLNAFEYGIYIDGSGNETLVANYGDLGNNGLKYTDLFQDFAQRSAASSIDKGYYQESDRVALEAYFEKAYGDTNVISGNIATIRAQLNVEYDSVLVDIEKTNTADITMNGATASYTGRAVLQGNSGNATVSATQAGFYKYDEDTGLGIENATFKLQYNNGGVWEDYISQPTMTTNADGFAQTDTLGAGVYRFVELSAPSEYDIESSEGYDAGEGTVISEEFTINPAASQGPIVLVSNIKYKFDVIYAPGDHGLFANDEHLDIVINSDTPEYAGELGTDGNPLGEAGWAFVGWDISVSPTVTESVTYTAIWREVYIYDIIYELDGGINSSNNPDIYEYGVGVPSFEDPTKDGYVFLGWYDVDGNEFTSISTEDFGTKTLYARWEVVEEEALIETGISNNVIILLAGVTILISFRVRSSIKK